MPSLTRVSLTFEQGLREDQEDSQIPAGEELGGAGAATVLDNWEHQPTGGLRARRQWQATSSTGAPTNRNGRGVVYWPAQNAFVVPVFNSSSTKYDIYKATGLSGNWSTIETAAGSAGTARYVPFAIGLSRLLYGSINLPLRQWDGTAAPAAIAGAPSATTCIAFHKNRFFVGTSTDNRLWYSGLGSYSSWGATDYIEVGNDNKLVSVAPFEDGLLIASTRDLHFLTGSGPDTFRLTQLNDGYGTYGTSLCATPYGAVIASYKEVWMWTGGSVQPIHGPIQESYSAGGLSTAYLTTAFIGTEVHISNFSTAKLFVYDLARQTWRIESVTTTAAGPANLATGAYSPTDDSAASSPNLLFSPRAGTSGGLASYRPYPSRTNGEDAATTSTYKAYTAEIWPGGPDEEVTPRHLWIKYRQHAANNTGNGVVVTPYYNGVANTTVPTATRTFGQQSAAGTYDIRIDLGTSDAKGINSVLFRFDHTIASGTRPLDIEEIVFGFELTRRHR